jgi:hypothetical protein
LSQPPMQNSCQLTNNWVPGWRPFHTSLLVFSSQADFQLKSLSPISYLYFTPLHSTEISLTHQLLILHATSLNWTADNSNSGTLQTLLITPRHGPHRNPVSIVIVQQYLDRCMRIHCSGNPFTERLPRNEYLFIRLLHSNCCTHYPFLGLYPATGLYAIVRVYLTNKHYIVLWIFKIKWGNNAQKYFCIWDLLRMHFAGLHFYNTDHSGRAV